MPFFRSSAGAISGDIKPWPTAFAPAGWLKCNGAAVSRTLYAALFNVIGTTYGVGDGSTTFNLPDLRGEFIRGLDDGRGIDTGRTIGSFQAGTQMTNGISGSNSLPRTMNTLTGAEETATQAGIGTNSASEPATSSGQTFRTRPRNVAALWIIKY